MICHWKLDFALAIPPEVGVQKQAHSQKKRSLCGDLWMLRLRYTDKVDRCAFFRKMVTDLAYHMSKSKLFHNVRNVMISN